MGKRDKGEHWQGGNGYPFSFQPFRWIDNQSKPYKWFNQFIWCNRKHSKGDVTYMRNKKLYSLAMAVTVSLLLFTGCGDKGEPVTADPESQEYTNENGYPIDQTSGTGDTSGEIVEAEKPVEEGNGMIGEDTDMTGDEYHEQLEQAEEEANKADQNLNESTGIEIVEELDKTMYAQQNCNSRSGDGTNYDKVASIEKGAQLHVTGRTSNDWYRVEWGDGVVYIAGSLLGDTAPTTPQTTTPSSSAGNSGSSSQQPSGGSALTPEEQADFDAFIQSIGGGGSVEDNSNDSWTHDL